MIRKKLKLAESKRSNDQSESIDASPFFTDRKRPAALWQRLYDVECRMSQELGAVTFNSVNVSAVYNPIEYAADLHCAYMKTFLTEAKAVLFIGMNPGPFGMVQTGVTVSNHHRIISFSDSSSCSVTRFHIQATF